MKTLVWIALGGAVLALGCESREQRVQDRVATAEAKEREVRHELAKDIQEEHAKASDKIAGARQDMAEGVAKAEDQARKDLGEVREDVRDARNDLARARFASDSCTAVAREARRLARLLAEPDGGIGDLGPRHVDARRKARAACAVASLRAELLPPSETREGLLGSLRAAGSEWRALGL